MNANIQIENNDNDGEKVNCLRSEMENRDQYLGLLYKTSGEEISNEEGGDYPAIYQKNRVSKYVRKRQDQAILTVFTRQVNLSLFNEKTPLYSMVREWVRNDVKKISKRKPRSKKMYSLPAALPAVGALKPADPLQPYPVNPTFKINYEHNAQLPSKEQLFAFHRKNWNLVKAYRKKEQAKIAVRYKASASIIHELFRAQKLLKNK